MKKLALIVLLMLGCSSIGMAQLDKPSTVVATCGTLSLTPGQPAGQYVDTTGQSCTNASITGATINVTQNTSGTATAANQATEITDLNTLVTAGGGGYVRQDSTATIAKESGGNLATIATKTTGASTAANQSTELTKLNGGLPAALGAGGGLKIDGSGTALPVSGTVTVTGNSGLADGGTFTAGATNDTPVAGLYESSPSTCATGKSCAFGLTTNREIKISIPNAGAVALGAFADGSQVTLGAKADAKSTATDTTSVTIMQVLKEISAMEQAPASRTVKLTDSTGTAFASNNPIPMRASDGTNFITDAAIGAALSSSPVPFACHNETSPTTIGNTQAGVPECDTSQRLIVVSPTAGNFLTTTRLNDGSGNAINSTGNALNVQCANCSGSGVSTADEAAFTAGSSVFVGAGGFYQTTATNNPLTTGQQGMLQMTANRAGFANLRNAAGAEIGIAGAPVSTSACSASICAGVISATTALKIDTSSIAGVATSTGNGVVGTGVQRVAIASDNTAFSVNGTLQTQTDTVMIGGVNVKEINAVTPLMGNGTTGTGSQRVTIASDNTAFSVNGTLQTQTDTVMVGGMNIKEINAVTPLMGAGNGGTGSLRVNIASDQLIIPVSAVGTTAVGSTYAGAPVNQACKGVNAEQTAVTNGQEQAQICDLVGKLIVLPYANPENFVNGTEVTITDTTSTATMASAGGSLRNYVTHCTLTNSHATVGTLVKILDGATVIDEVYLPALGGGASLTYTTPLKGTAATAVNIQPMTTGSNILGMCNGYKGL